MSVTGLLTKRRWWLPFGICQIVGCVVALLARNDWGFIIAFLLLAPGSFVAAIPLTLVAFVAGGWGALPVWVWFLATPVVIVAINFALWSVVDSLRTNHARSSRPV
jgi:hypothetical protein